MNDEYINEEVSIDQTKILSGKSIKRKVVTIFPIWHLEFNWVKKPKNKQDWKAFQLLEVWFYMNGPSKLAALISCKQFLRLQLYF